MAVLAQIYSQTWLLAPVLSNVEAEQIKKEGEGEKGRQREKSSLTAAFSMLLHVVKMCPLRSVLRQLTHCSCCN